MFNDYIMLWTSLKDLKQDSDLFSYLSTAKTTTEQYKKIMPITNDIKAQEKWDILMVLILADLLSNLDAVCQQVLGNAEIPMVDDLVNQLLWLSFNHNRSDHYQQFYLGDTY